MEEDKIIPEESGNVSTNKGMKSENVQKLGKGGEIQTFRPTIKK